MYEQHVNRKVSHDRSNTHRSASKQWIDSVDLELIFMNSIAICVILLAIVAADVFI